jgi:hypothetical protein
MLNNPVMDKGNLMDNGIPIALHGDGVPCTKKKSLECLSWSSLLGMGSTLDVKFLATGVFSTTKAKQDEHGTDTMDKVWTVIRWSLEACIAGTWPTHDWDGKPVEGEHALLAGQHLAGGLFLVPWVVKGDMEYLANALHLAHWNSDPMCCMCHADHADLPWTDFSDAAAWKDTCGNDPATWQEEQGKPHVLFTTPGLNVNMVMFDVLHVVDLGVSLHVQGNVLFELAMGMAPGDTAMARTQHVWHMVQAFYRATHGSTRPCPCS